jgi:hypothetical protein
VAVANYKNCAKTTNLLLNAFLRLIPPGSEFYKPTFRNTMFHLYRQVGKLFTCLPMKMEQTECSETSAYKIQTPGELPGIKHTNIQNTAKV